MTLQFNPAPYLEAFQYGQNRDAQARQQETQGIQGIGQGIGQLAQIPAQQQQDRMNQLTTALKLKEQNIDPTNAMNYLKTGQFPQQGSASPDQTSQPSPMPFLSQNTIPQNSQSDMQPSNIPPQEPGGFSDRMNGTGESPIVTAHKQVLMDPNHPYKPQAPQQQGMSSLFQSPNVDYGKIVSGMDQGDYSGYQGLNEKQRGDVEKIREYNSNKADRQSKDKELQDYRNQMLDLQRNKTNENGLAKTDKEDRKRWDEIIKETDPYKASARSPIGMAQIGNLKADHVIPMLQNPNATNQDINAALAGLDTVLQGGAATESGIHSQEYNTLAAKWSNLKTLLTSQPQAVATPEIKQHLIEMLTGLKQVNNSFMKDHLDYIETAHPDLIQKNSVAWQGVRKRLNVDNAGSAAGTNQGGGQLTPDVVSYAQKHNITPQQALQIKMQRTGGR